MEKLKETGERLSGAPQMDKSKSWMTGVAKPSLGWFEGRITKFIAGDGETGLPSEGGVHANGRQKSYAGAFAAFSNISTDNSRNPSPRPSYEQDRSTSPVYPLRSHSTSFAASMIYDGNSRPSSPAMVARPRSETKSSSLANHKFSPTEPISNRHWWQDKAELYTPASPPEGNAGVAEPNGSTKFQPTDDEEVDDLGLGNSKSKLRSQDKPNSTSNGDTEEKNSEGAVEKETGPEQRQG
jgi:hypothetical protein